MQDWDASVTAGGADVDGGGRATSVHPLADGCDLGQLSYGLSSDGRLVHVSEVERGLRCGCRCAACGGALVARRGDIRAAHFAHHASAECAGAWETTLHLLAKQVLSGSNRVLLPEAVATVDGLTERVARAAWFTYGAVREEVDLGSVRPDVVVTGKGRDLLVEVAVTHFCDAEKVAKLRGRDLPAIEIDLSRVPRLASREQHADQILRVAPRAWLHNAKLSAAEERLRAVAERRTAERDARQRLAWEEAATTLSRAVSAPPEPFGSGWIGEAREAGLGHLLGLHVEGDFCFCVDRETWQARFLAMAIDDRRGEAFDAMEALGRFRQLGLLRRSFDREFAEPGEVAVLRERMPGLRPPVEVLRAYAGLLVEAKFLFPLGRNAWFVPPAPLSEARDRARLAREARNRLAALRRMAARLKESLGPGAADTLRQWASSPLRDGGRTPLELAESGGDAWKDLVRALDDLADMTKPGGTAVDPERLLDLPLGSARAARLSEEAERQAQRDAARRRRARAFLEFLVAEADRWFGRGKGAAWVRDRLGDGLADPGHDARFEQDAPFRREIEAALLAEGSRLARERRQDEERAAAADEARRKAAVARDGLLNAAISAFLDADRAALWMRSTNPALGGPPHDVCTDPEGMARCTRLLEAVRGGNARRR
jgi:hypothetical protein